MTLLRKSLVVSLISLITVVTTSWAQPSQKSILTEFTYPTSAVTLYTEGSGPIPPLAPGSIQAIVEQDTVQNVGTEPASVPPEGLLIRGHGLSAQWIRNILKPGAKVTIDANQHQLLVSYTPWVYVKQVDAILSMVKPEFITNSGVQKAQACRATLNHQAEIQQLLTPAFLTQFDACEHLADIAYYQTIPVIEGEFRGVWLRPSEKSAEEIHTALLTLKRLHIQNIFLETYYQGETIYPSQVMAQYGLPIQHTEFLKTNPLQAWIQEAHQESLSVHAWVQTFFAGNASENIDPMGPILKRYPQWYNVPRVSALSHRLVPSTEEPGHYFLHPANPEVRAFLHKLLLEIVTQYDFDGLNLDYIRYPASRAVSQPGFAASTWGYSEIARKTFESQALAEWHKTHPPVEKTVVKIIRRRHRRHRIHVRVIVTPTPPNLDPMALTPASPYWNRWVQWREEQVNSFVQTITKDAHAQRPNLLMSAVVFPQSDPLFQWKLQNWPHWVQEGWIQALTPIGFSPNPTLMRIQCQKMLATVQRKVPIYAGILGMYNRLSPIEFLKQINTVHQAGMQGIMLFEWSKITPAYEEALQEGPFRQ